MSDAGAKKGTTDEEREILAAQERAEVLWMAAEVARRVAERAARAAVHVQSLT